MAFFLDASWPSYSANLVSSAYPYSFYDSIEDAKLMEQGSFVEVQRETVLDV